LTGLNSVLIAGCTPTRREVERTARIDAGNQPEPLAKERHVGRESALSPEVVLMCPASCPINGSVQGSACQPCSDPDLGERLLVSTGQEGGAVPGALVHAAEQIYRGHTRSDSRRPKHY